MHLLSHALRSGNERLAADQLISAGRLTRGARAVTRLDLNRALAALAALARPAHTRG